MRISILTPDVSRNCLGRAYVLAQLLERFYEIEIVGPELQDGVWGPLAGEYDYKTVKMLPIAPNLLFKYGAIAEKVTGDVVYVSKPRTTSYGFGLLHSVLADKPLLLDVDDWESGFRYDGTGHRVGLYLRAIVRLGRVRSLYYTRLLERLTSVADEITVSNRFLQSKFGGEIIPHVRDTSRFDPSRFDERAVRAELGLPLEKRIVLFSGTPRRHKGVHDLIDAAKRLDRDDVVVLVVGAHDSEYVRELREQADDRVLFRGQQPFSEFPKWIAAADLFAIPQTAAPSTQGQLPAKVFDAMAMGKPIVASRVSDLPEILDGCGRLVAPGSPEQLATAMAELLDDPDRMRELGRAAREKCVREYSYDAMAPKLAAVVERAVDGTDLAAESRERTVDGIELASENPPR